jgi:two-component system response regulator FixJ
MSHRGKVYVIDDDEAMRDSLDFMLGAADFQVTLFESDNNFLDTISNIDFGCVVYDVRMI